MRSSGCSRPIDRRTVPGVMPAAASAASSMRKCVVVAGWITSDFASPMLARCEKSESASMNLRPASRPPFSSKDEDRAAAARIEPRGERVVRDAPARSGWCTRSTASCAARNCATIVAVFSMCRAMRSGSVSSPCRIWNAVIGAMHAPKSRRPSRRARSRNADAVDSSVNTMPWKPSYGSVSVGNLPERLPVEAPAVDEHAPDHHAVAREELGRRVHDEVRALLEGRGRARASSPSRRRASGIACSPASRGQGRNVEHVDRGIAHGLAEEQPRPGSDRARATRRGRARARTSSRCRSAAACTRAGCASRRRGSPRRRCARPAP